MAFKRQPLYNLGLVTGTVVGFFYSWQLTLFSMLFFPVLVGSAMIQYRMSMGIDGAQNKSNEDSSKLAIEAITNIRTIAG